MIMDLNIYIRNHSVVGYLFIYLFGMVQLWKALFKLKLKSMTEKLVLFINF